MERLQRELEQMVSGRYPNLHKLTPDEVLPVDERYVKNIVFSRISRGREELFEYRVVMENRDGQAVVPRFRVLAFDRRGVQVGVDEVRQLDELRSSESRSYSATLDLFMSGEPAYFHIDFSTPDSSGSLGG